MIKTSKVGGGMAQVMEKAQAGVDNNLLHVSPVSVEDIPGEVAGFRVSDGTRVSLILKQGRERIMVASGKGEIFFEYSPDTGKCSFKIPKGDLLFEVPQGDISFSSGKNISLDCRGDLNLKGRNRVEVSSGGLGPAAARMALEGERLDISGRKISAMGQQGDLSLVKSRFRGRLFSARLDSCRLHSDHLEILADNIVQKSRRFCQQVEQLFQVSAGKMRTFVDGLFHLKGRRAYLKAEKEIKMKGERIHLR